MDVVGDAICRALTAFTKAPTPAAGYATIASLLQEVGHGRRPASDDELRQAVRLHTQLPMSPHEPFEDALDVVVALVDAMLHFNGLYADIELIRNAARPAVQTRRSPWAMGGLGRVLSWEEITETFKNKEDKE